RRRPAPSATARGRARSRRAPRRPRRAGDEVRPERRRPWEVTGLTLEIEEVTVDGYARVDEGRFECQRGQSAHLRPCVRPCQTLSDTGGPPRMTPPVPTLLVLDADPPPRLGRLTGRARIVRTDAAGLAARLPSADVLLVWDFASQAVRAAWPGAGPRPRWV